MPWPPIFNYLRILAEGRPRQSPSFLVIEATNLCNRHCDVCGAAQAARPGAKGYMDWDLFLGLAAEAQALGPEKVCLYARGESLLHPRIVDMTAELSGRGLSTQIITNGDRLDPDLSKRLREAGLDELLVSHPAVTLENYRACRSKDPGADDDRRLTDALAVWEGSGKRVQVRCLVLPAKLADRGRDLGRFLSLWLPKTGVSEVLFTGYQPWPHHVIEEFVPLLYTGSPPCELMLDGLNVLYNGDITPCSYDVDGELVLGRWPELSLHQAYHGPKIKSLRRRNILRRGLPAVCRGCLVTRVPAVQIDVPVSRMPEPPERERWLKIQAVRCWQAFQFKERPRPDAPGKNRSDENRASAGNS